MMRSHHSGTVNIWHSKPMTNCRQSSKHTLHHNMYVPILGSGAASGALCIPVTCTESGTRGNGSLLREPHLPMRIAARIELLLSSGPTVAR